MAAASEDEELPYIRGVQLGTLFNSRTGQIAPPDKGLQVGGRKLKEPKTWKRWTVVRTGPDLYRALHVPYPLALKVLAGQAPEPDVPLVEWRQALSSPNCRAVLLQAGTEMRERTVEGSVDTPVVNPHHGMTHFVHRVIRGRQLFILAILTAKEEHDIEYIDDVLAELPDSHDDFDGVKSAFKKLDSKMKRSKGVQASFSVRPKNWKEEIKSLEEAVKLLSDFLSQPESVAEPCSKSAAAAATSSDDEDASDNPVPVIKCFLRSCHGEASSEDLPAKVPPEKHTRKEKQNFDRLYHNCLRAKELLDNTPNAQYRDYQKRKLEKRQNAIAQRKGEFEEAIKSLSVFEKLLSSEEKELINKYKRRDFKTESYSYLEMLEYKLPPSKGPLNLLLLGKTGHGKSSTGNTILQLPGAFKASGNTSATTTGCKMREAEIDGQRFKVVDTPGIFDPSNVEESFAEICTAITLCTEGFHAVLLVWKFGSKMTPEEIESIKCLKRIFGEDLLKKHGVFLLTNGDQFELTMQNEEHNHKSFDKWISEQMDKDKNFKDIVLDCQGRYVLFDNITKAATKKREQLLCLTDAVLTIIHQGNPVLRDDLFQHAKENLDKEMRISEDAQETLQKEKKLVEKIDVILKAVAELSLEEQKEVEIRVRYLQGLRLHLTDNFDRRSKLLDEALGDADDLESDVEERVFYSRSASCAFDGACFRNSVSENDIVSDLDKLGNQAEETYHRVEQKAAAAGRRTAQESDKSCFPGNATVRLQDGRQVKMTSLHEGDVVLCGRKDGCLTYSTVYMFGHKDEFPPLCCLALSTRTATLRVSQDHLVFRRHLGKYTAVPARHVQVGDAIAVYRPGAATLQWESVTHIQSQWETGVMAPFTLEGTVVVDDVLASCYVAVTSHTLCHALLWPMRKLAVLAPRLSAHLHRPGEGGLPPWVRLCLHHLLPWQPRHRLLSA